MRLGAAAIAFALAAPLVPPAATYEVPGGAVPAAFARADVLRVARPPSRVRDLSLPEPVAASETTREPPVSSLAPTVETPDIPGPMAAGPAAELLAVSGAVLASWYGPGFFGGRTACGQTYTPDLAGVAHPTLPCGTIVTLTHGGRAVTVPVIDRGPFVMGRSLDLSSATRAALACADLCTLSLRIGQ